MRAGRKTVRLAAVGLWGPSQPACSKARSISCLPDSTTILPMIGVTCQDSTDIRIKNVQISAAHHGSSTQHSRITMKWSIP
jgi:hypothetical protein